MDQQKIGRFLKQLRKEKGITQDQAAEHFCVATRTISRWETGSNMPDLEILLSIAEFYDVEVDEIIDGQRSDNDENSVYKVIGKVDEYMAMKNRIIAPLQKVIMSMLILILTIICIIKSINVTPLAILSLAFFSMDCFFDPYVSKFEKIMGVISAILVVAVFIVFIIYV